MTPVAKQEAEISVTPIQPGTGKSDLPLDARVVLAGILSTAIWVSTAQTTAGAAGWVGALVLTLVLWRKRIGERLPSFGRFLKWGVFLSLLVVAVRLAIAWLETGSPVGEGAVQIAGRSAFRLIGFVLLAMCIVAVSSPMNLALGITRLLRPLKKLGIPVENVFYFVYFVFRMIPFLVDEARTIRLAQESRGIRLKGGLRARARSAPALVIPVLAAAGRRADRLSMALWARGFDVRRLPDAVGELRFEPWDYGVTAGLLVGWAVWIWNGISI